MEKKTSKRQTTIISLSDQNQKEIQDIKTEKQDMLDEYEAKKAGIFRMYPITGYATTLILIN